MGTANASANKAVPDTTVAFRLPVSRRLMLVAIGSERAHPNLTETLRDAVDAYIDSYLREKTEAA